MGIILLLRVIEEERPSTVTHVLSVSTVRVTTTKIPVQSVFVGRSGIVRQKYGDHHN
jgi:hypothetical protein